MRLHRLELAAFGPFAGPQEIDFDRLAGTGLFLLEGPTGAGKSTILDAITFALYGGLAGQDAGSDRLHSHFAPPGTEPSVALEFSVRGVRYLITRVPEYRRPKRRGDGYTTEAMRVHLRRREEGRWVSLSANKAETGEAIADIVGLSRTQFTQVMLLPQGEFARFLRCDDDARRAVLTKLFGTELYDSITAELDLRRAAAMKECQAAQRAVADAVSAAAEAAGLDAGARAELVALRDCEQESAFARMERQAAAALAEAERDRSRAAQRASLAEEAGHRAATQAELMTRLTGALAALAAHAATEPEHCERATRLDAATRAEPVGPLLAALHDAEAVAADARAALRTVLGLKPAKDRPARQAARQAPTSGQPAAAADVIGAPGAGRRPASGEPAGQDDSDVTDADVAGARLLGLVTEPAAGAGSDPAAAGLARKLARAAAARAETARERATGLTHLVEEENELPARTAVVRELDRAAASARERAEALTSARQQLPEVIAAAGKNLAGAQAGAAALDGARQRQRAVADLRAAADRRAGLEPRLAAAEAALQAAVDIHQRLTDEHQEAMDARLAGLAAELAAGLADGAPCPVCGSCAHPRPARSSAVAVTADAVEAARAARDRAAAKRREAEDAHAALDRQVGEFAAIAGGHTVAELAAEAAAAAAGVAEAMAAAEVVPALTAELDALREQRERLGEDLRAAAEAETAARRDAERASADRQTLIGRLGSASDGYPSVRARQAGLRRAANEDSALAGALEALAAALDAAGQARGRAADEARARGFGSLARASAAVLPPGERSALAGQVDGWARTMTALRAAAEAPELAGMNPDLAEATAADAEACAAALHTARLAEQAAVSAHESLQRRRDRLRGRLAEARSAKAAAARLAEATAPVIYLAGLAKGVDGERRIALTTYVLRHWFEQVVAAANTRLKVMSSGRYELRRSDEAESRRQRAGLTLSVIDRHTGEERGPKSLSGGETFYTSLALALGLADVVRAQAGGAETQTLFIDEGFGSLDAETLDQVLGVIDELREGGRAVGIVSHVADLKDRVAERLQVRRLPDGSSTLRVVA